MNKPTLETIALLLIFQFTAIFFGAWAYAIFKLFIDGLFVEGVFLFSFLLFSIGGGVIIIISSQGERKQDE